jgi:hypothetical protein
MPTNRSAARRACLPSTPCGVSGTRIPPRCLGGCQRAKTPSVMLSRQISDSSM